MSHPDPTKEYHDEHKESDVRNKPWMDSTWIDPREMEDDPTDVAPEECHFCGSNQIMLDLFEDVEYYSCGFCGRSLEEPDDEQSGESDNDSSTVGIPGVEGIDSDAEVSSVRGDQA